ncbi:MAG: hypothetical protein ABL927_06595, partial [Bdellovibrionales bacterium]
MNIFIWSIFIVFQVVGYILFKKIIYKKLLHRKIFKLETRTDQVWVEFLNSVISNSIFVLSGVIIFYLQEAGLTQIYFNIDKFGIWYLLLSF